MGRGSCKPNLVPTGQRDRQIAEAPVSEQPSSVGLKAEPWALVTATLRASHNFEYASLPMAP
jgi:hypothetical protein